MKIAILGAMDQEIALLKDAIEQLQTHQIAHLTFYTGKIAGVEVILAKCGIGKVAAAVATTIIIQQFSPTHVVNTGSAGGFDTDLSIGDIVISTHVKHHDVDITHFGYALGQCANQPESYSADLRLIEAAQVSAKALHGITSKQGLVCTGDSFIGSDEAAAVLRKNFPDIAAVEMEGASIAQTSHMLNVPFLVIRSLSDIAGKTSTTSFETYLDQAAKNSAALVIGMLSTL